ncbi:molybdopterin binding aldehyde oxidase/xanthine dehydrogenase [Pelagophyceae sp. CCMP2097]|nr:molybdopterin binding aldehyde oxidase/xanthine dehydrogenase [Pelagophyceae sp. CCMP2097]
MEVSAFSLFCALFVAVGFSRLLSLWWRPALAAVEAAVVAVEAAPSKACAGKAAVHADASSTVVFSVNGVVRRVGAAPDLTLLAYLRDDLGLTGAKVGCGEGGCGACTVVDSAEGFSINSCLRLVAACDGLDIKTVEGLGGSKTEFSPEQLAIADNLGSQCGYCTPGWVMAMHGLNAGAAKRGETLKPLEVQEKLDGNICRCTGYRPIVEAFRDAFAVEDAVKSCHDTTTQRACGRACDAAARNLGAPAAREIRVRDESKNIEFYQPTSLQHLYGALDDAPALSYDDGEGRGQATPTQKTLVGGATAGLGVSKYYDDVLRPWVGGFAPQSDSVLVATRGVDSLHAVDQVEGHLRVGSAATISQLITALERGGGNARGMAARHLKRVANTQVRNAGTWAGNLGLAAACPKFPSDVAVALAAIGATLDVSRRSVEVRASGKATRTVEMRVAVDGLALGAGDVILCLDVPPTQNDERVFCDKVAARHANAHAIVNCGLRLSAVSQARLFFGGLSPAGLLRARRCEQALVSVNVVGMGDAELHAAVAALRLDAGGADAYAADIAVAMLFKFLKSVKTGTPVNSLAVDRALTTSSQDIGGASDSANKPASMPMPKLGARLQASGEAQYCSDAPRAIRELSLAFAVAGSAGALRSVECGAAMRTPGCVDVLVGDDVTKLCATLGLDDDDDQLVFGVGAKVFVGARVAIVLATSDAAAVRAARAVACAVDGAAPAPRALTADKVRNALDGHFDASKASGRKGLKLGLHRNRLAVEASGRLAAGGGAAPLALDASDDDATLHGSVSFGMQKHFHLETHSARAVPTEDGRLEVYSSAQDLTAVQRVVAQVLGLRAHQVVASCRRAGGAFGGKISLNIPYAVGCAVAAAKHGVAVRVHADRRDDMRSTGGREPVRATYAVSTTDAASTGLASYAAHFDMSTGHASQDSVGDLGMCLQWSDNAYRSGSHSATGAALKTAAPRNSSMRSPGVLTSHTVREVAMARVAHARGRQIIDVQSENMYRAGDATPYGDAIGNGDFNFTLPQLWEEAKADFLVKRDAVNAFNKQSRWRKRGIHLMPVKYDISLAGYRSACLASIFSDGSVEVSTGGAELGQGLFTKVAQVAALTLGCAIGDVRVGDTSTSKTANATCTGGSATSESCCNAAAAACATLAQRLGDAETPWLDRVAAAFGRGDELSATGWSAPPPHEGGGADYATYGVGLAEVEVDVLTGEVEIREVKLKMDQGTSLNAAVDLGQIEGAVVMTLGYLFTEDCAVSADGAQTGDGTWDYKPPQIADMPLVFAVAMLASAPNPAKRAVLGSKASAEPPMQLAIAAFMAARDAISAARGDGGDDAWFDLDVPATTRAIRAACKIADANLTLADAGLTLA